MTIHRIPDYDAVTTAITEHLAMLFDENDTIDTDSQPHGTIGIETIRTEGNTGEVVVKALGRRFKFELYEIL